MRIVSIFFFHLFHDLLVYLISMRPGLVFDILRFGLGHTF